MTLYEEHLQYAQDVLFVMKNIDIGNIGNDSRFSKSYSAGSYWIKYNYGDKAAGASNYPFTSHSVVAIEDGYIRHTQSAGLKMYNKGECTFVSGTDAVLTLSEEQYFQNSLIYNESEQLQILIYATLSANKFTNFYNMLSIRYLNELKNSILLKDNV